MTNEEKEKLFKYPDPDQRYFSRKSHSLFHNGVLRHTFVSGTRGKEEIIVAGYTPDAGGNLGKQLFRGPRGTVIHPVLAEKSTGTEETVYLFWAEEINGFWYIKGLPIDPVSSNEMREAPEPMVLHRTAGAVNSLAAAGHNQDLYVAWTETGKTSASLFLGTVSSPSLKVIFAQEEGLFFRPDIAADSRGITLAWDEYREKKYKIHLLFLENMAGPNHMEQKRLLLEREGEDWNHPRILRRRGNTYAVWLATSDVTDHRGIFDRHSRIRGAFFPAPGGGPVFLTDKKESEDPENIGDLREGLLPKRVSKGYVGLRRNPQLVSLGESVLLCWEVRREEDKTSIAGTLLGRRIGPSGEAERPVEIHRGGYCYSLPKRGYDTGAESPPLLPMAFLQFEEKDFNIPGGGFFPVPPFSRDKGEVSSVHDINSEDWKNWRPASFEAPLREREKMARALFPGSGNYRVFWGDTHCHGIGSPDAEGETDELILYGRDRAGLDIVSVLDNDFYPYKAQTMAEWLIKKAISVLFTREGQFLVLPGYEYASHSPENPGEFNHRCVLFPPGEGVFYGRMHPGTETIERAVQKLKTRDRMFLYPHHCGYTIVDEEVEKNVEVISSWRVCIEETDFTAKQLEGGRKFGFIGSSDTHRQIPGLGGALTGFIAKRLAFDALLEAFRNRRLIATQGKRILIEFSVNEYVTGEEGTTTTPPRISVKITAPESIESIRFLRNGETIFEETPETGAETFTGSFTDSQAPRGNLWYCCRVKLAGDEALNREGGQRSGPDSLVPFTNDSDYPHNMAKGRGPLAWSSPVFIEYTNNTEGGGH